MNVGLICHRAWSESIHAGLARRSQIMKYDEFRIVEKQASAEICVRSHLVHQ